VATLIALIALTACTASAQSNRKETKDEQTQTAIDSTSGKVMETSERKVVETTTTIDSATGKQVTSSNVVTISTERDLTVRENLITLNPVKFAWMYNLTYYRNINNTIVVGGGFQVPTALAMEDYSGFGLNASMRFYPTGKNMRGFFIEPNVTFNTLSEKTSQYVTDPTTGNGQYQEVENTYRPLTIGVLTGWQWFMGDNFSMGLAVGADNYMYPFGGTKPSTAITDPYGSYSYTTKIFPVIYDGLQPTVRFDLGFAW
jgi:hypothetical protein